MREVWEQCLFWWFLLPCADVMTLPEKVQGKLRENGDTPVRWLDGDRFGDFSSGPGFQVLTKD